MSIPPPLASYPKNRTSAERGSYRVDCEARGAESALEGFKPLKNQALVIGPSITIGAVMPPSRRPPTNVVVFQWPWSAPARSRSPRGALPRVRAILVVAPVSSMNTMLDAGLATICGEESAGAGSDYVREKDGLWAVLLQEHWAQFGRDLYARHDYEGVDAADAEALMADLRERVGELAGVQVGSLVVERADDCSYHDPVDGSVSHRQGVRVFFAGGARAVFRLSGTGTSGATLRVYLERHLPPPMGDGPPRAGDSLAEVAAAAEALAEIGRRTGRAAPDVVT